MTINDTALQTGTGLQYQGPVRGGTYLVSAQLPTSFQQNPGPDRSQTDSSTLKAVKLKPEDSWVDLIAYCLHVNYELYHHAEGESGRRLTKQTQYDWDNPENGMEAGKEIYSSGWPLQCLG